jgi:hypothetical protein
MSVCTKCGRENQTHYKLCLGCGKPLHEEADVPLVESATASGRFCYVSTYRDGKYPLSAQLLFHDPEDAAECARVLSTAKKPKKEKSQ